jgi:hypothetical protein
MSDEWRVHRPFDPDYLDLDPSEQIDRGYVLGAAVWGGIAGAARLAVEFEKLFAGLGQRGHCGLVMGHGILRIEHS